MQVEFGIGEWVTFKDVEGMTEINNIAVSSRLCIIWYTLTHVLMHTQGVEGMTEINNIAVSSHFYV